MSKPGEHKTSRARIIAEWAAMNARSLDCDPVVPGLFIVTTEPENPEGRPVEDNGQTTHLNRELRRCPRCGCGKMAFGSKVRWVCITNAFDFVCPECGSETGFETKGAVGFTLGSAILYELFSAKYFLKEWPQDFLEPLFLVSGCLFLSSVCILIFDIPLPAESNNPVRARQHPGLFSSSDGDSLQA